MTLVAALRPIRRIHAPTSAWQVSVATSVAEVGRIWDALDRTGGSSIYQRRRFLEPWIAQVAPARGLRPALGVVADAHGRYVALLPFGIARRGPLRLAQFLGGRDSNLNMPLLDPAFPLTTGDARDILQVFSAALKQRLDLLVLSNQPRTWNGRSNPFAFTGATPSPSNAYGATFTGDAEAFLDAQTSRATRRKLRAKAAHAAALGTIEFARVGPREVATTVETFIAQKQTALARRGIDAGLDQPSVRGFLGSLGTPPDDAAVLELYVLRIADRIAAVFGGLPDRAHWHGLINSYDNTPAFARCSPGELLLRHVVSDLGRRGFASFDLGIGEARYKDALCSETIELVDAIVPLTAAGQLFAAGEALRLSAKGAIKRRPWAHGALQQACGWMRPR